MNLRRPLFKLLAKNVTSQKKIHCSTNIMVWKTSNGTQTFLPQMKMSSCRKNFMVQTAALQFFHSKPILCLKRFRNSYDLRQNLNIATAQIMFNFKNVAIIKDFTAKMFMEKYWLE